jgi:cell wall-associated NlpC family hydrolase
MAGGIKPFPLPFTPQTVANLGNQFMGRHYGWGGAFLERDCSLMLQDLFKPFGIWLPRNSAAQLKIGRVTNLSGMSPGAKTTWLAQNGVPFRTIVGFPGHVTLYLGQYKGESVIFHSIWGLRTMTPRGEGRAVLGKVCVTSVTPGRELPNIIPDRTLLHRFTAAATVLVGGGH